MRRIHSNGTTTQLGIPERIERLNPDGPVDGHDRYAEGYVEKKASAASAEKGAKEGEKKEEEKGRALPPLDVRALMRKAFCRVANRAHSHPLFHPLAGCTS